jgi:hypothetical protein
MRNLYYNLIIKLLKNSYPVVRLKHNKRFKRAIVIDDQVVFLSLDQNKDHFHLLTDKISNIFSINYKLAMDIVKEYYS